jgi:hypothetical protein
MHPNDKVFALQRAVSLVEKAGEDLRELLAEAIAEART